MKRIISIIIRVIILASVFTALTAVVMFSGEAIDFTRATSIVFGCYIFFFGNLFILFKLDKRVREGNRFDSRIFKV